MQGLLQNEYIQTSRLRSRKYNIFWRKKALSPHPENRAVSGQQDKHVRHLTDSAETNRANPAKCLTSLTFPRTRRVRLCVWRREASVLSCKAQFFISCIWHLMLTDTAHAFANVRTDHAQDLLFVQLNSSTFSHKLLCCKDSLLLDIRLQ
jgi:hypothetical protein